MVEMDLRGYECPMPVVKTMKAIEKNPGEVISVLVEKESSCDDISRMSQKKNYAVSVEKVSRDYRLTLTPPNSIKSH